MQTRNGKLRMMNLCRK